MKRSLINLYKTAKTRTNVAERGIICILCNHILIHYRQKVLSVHYRQKFMASWSKSVTVDTLQTGTRLHNNKNFAIYCQTCTYIFSFRGIFHCIKRLSSRLQVVPHLSSGIVEWAKHKHTWKSPHTRKGDTQQEERKMRGCRQSPNFWTYA